ncbi:MAG: hypothetical protein ABW170_16840 [Candidatus Thiodiazotropha sp. L084R]
MSTDSSGFLIPEFFANADTPVYRGKLMIAWHAKDDEVHLLEYQGRTEKCISYELKKGRYTIRLTRETMSLLVEYAREVYGIDPVAWKIIQNAGEAITNQIEHPDSVYGHKLR